jgi:hypothetical protein
MWHFLSKVSVSCNGPLLANGSENRGFAELWRIMQMEQMEGVSIMNDCLVPLSRWCPMRIVVQGVHVWRIA